MEQWRRLRCSSDEIPALHVKATFDSDGYSIRLTDLSRVWSETLTKGDILERARRRNCSIDPSEDDEQFGVLLEKLKSALSQSNGTAAALSTTKDGGLKLHLEVSLPKPLPALEWEASLEPASDGNIGDEIVTPLLRQLDTLNRQRQSLLAEIQAKDKIVYKLTDRLETSGHRIQDIFPGVSKVNLARGKPLREGLGRHVRGLGEFNEQAWAAQFEVGPNAVDLPSGSVDTILASLPVQSIDAGGARTSGDWWKNIPADQQIELGDASAGKEDIVHNKTPDQPSNANGDDTPELIGDDEFQRQATPPRLRAQPPPTAGQEDIDMHEADDDSTEDEDDLDGPSQKASKPDPKPTKHTLVDTAPTVNSKAASPPPKSSHKPQAPANNGPFPHDDEDTEDEDEDDLDAPSQPSQKAASSSQLPSRQKSQTPQPTTSAAQSPPRKRLGTLGGRARTKSPAVEKTPPSVAEPREPTLTNPSPKPKPKSKLGTLGGSKAKSSTNPPSPKSNSPPPAKKLGTIGGKRATASTVRSDRAATASTEPEPQQQGKEPAEVRKEEPKAEPEEPVNVEERANAKRDALKRELEAKAKAPVKKKRKF